jgi:FMN phosphatase YigB (HAD superfamily)
MVRTVVFDVGETLVDESRVWELWADRLGVPGHVLFAALGAAIERGEHHRSIFERLRPGFDAARAGVADGFEARDLYPDVRACLHALHERGLRIGVAGNQPEGMEQVLEGLPVDFVACPARWNAEKPSPLFFRKLAEEARTAPGEMAYVGDRLDNDIVPALEAGMIAVFIRRGPWGYLHARRPEAARAHLRIDSLSELGAALGLRERKIRRGGAEGAEEDAE